MGRDAFQPGANRREAGEVETTVVESHAAVHNQARDAPTDLGVEHLRAVETDDRHRLSLPPLLEPYDLRSPLPLCHPQKCGANPGEFEFHALLG
jgi:hypothetical protein